MAGIWLGEEGWLVYGCVRRVGWYMVGRGGLAGIWLDEEGWLVYGWVRGWMVLGFDYIVTL